MKWSLKIYITAKLDDCHERFTLLRMYTCQELLYKGIWYILIYKFDAKMVWYSYHSSIKCYLLVELIK